MFSLALIIPTVSFGMSNCRQSAGFSPVLLKADTGKI